MDNERPPYFRQVEDSWDEDAIDMYVLREKLRQALDSVGNVMTDEERDTVEEALQDAYGGADSLTSPTARELPPSFDETFIPEQEREMLALALTEGVCEDYSYHHDAIGHYAEVNICITVPMDRIDGQ